MKYTKKVSETLTWDGKKAGTFLDTLDRVFSGLTYVNKGFEIEADSKFPIGTEIVWVRSKEFIEYTKDLDHYNEVVRLHKNRIIYLDLLQKKVCIYTPKKDEIYYKYITKTGIRISHYNEISLDLIYLKVLSTVYNITVK